MLWGRVKEGALVVKRDHCDIQSYFIKDTCKIVSKQKKKKKKREEGLQNINKNHNSLDIT